MENKGLISVIIPVYNVEKYLKECVDSVLYQTYKNYEIILVDDGSTDSSPQICDEYASKYECVSVIHKENSGLSHTRNKGLSVAQGEYVYFLDSDDYIDSNAFTMLVESIENENADFVFFDSRSFEDDSRNFNIPQNYIRKERYSTTNGIEMLKQLCENKDFHSAVPLFFFKSDFIRKEKLTFFEGVFYEDVLFAYQSYCKANNVTHVNSAIYFRRYRANSIMTSNKTVQHFKSIVAVLNELVLFSSASFNALNGVQKAYISRVAFNVFNIYDGLSRDDKIICKKQMLEVKNKIIKDNAYDNKALKMRCYGKAFWFIYKVYEKTVGRLFI